VLARALDDLEPVLTRNGYDAATLATQLRAKPAEIRDFSPARSRPIEPGN
jgi:hypothetical protein